MSIQSFIDNNDNSNSHQSNSSNKLHEFDLHHQNKHKTTTSIISSMKSSQIDVINLNDGLTIRVNNHFYQNMSKISNINKIRQTIYQNFLIDIEKAETQVFQQISKEKLDKIQQLFKRYPLPFNIKKKKSYSNNNLLHQSVKIGSRNIIDYFMMRNEKLINQGNIYGKTPIHFCLIYHPNLLSHFIKNWDKYVDWNYKDKIGSTYLHYCYFYNLDQSIKQLIEKKNIESTNILGMNSFQCVPEAQTHCKFKYHKEGEDQISNRKIQYFKKDNRNQQKKAFKFSKLIYSKQNSEISQQNLQNTVNEIKIDDFDIVSKLGQGAYSKVFKVKYKPSQNYYALKAFEKYKLDWKKLKYFLNQRNVLMNSSHPYLIKFYCSFQNSKFLFLITELCEGGTLKDIIYNNNQFITQQKAKIYVTQIVSVVSYLHDKSIIHRDIKPQNIGLDRDGHIKLFDLGLSKSLKKNMTRTFCGTEDYLPPEVINNQQYTYTIDWYILGVMIYEMLTKTMPKKQKLEIQKFTDSLKDLIKKLLQPDKDLRIGSKRDGQEIKQHSWFNDINWNTVSKKKVINARIVKKQDPQLSKTTKLTDWFQNVQNQVINQNFDEIDSWNSTVRML